LVVLNSPARGIGGETNRVTLVERRSARKLPEMSKREVAEAILDRVLELRAAAGAAAGRAKPKSGRAAERARRSKANNEERAAAKPRAPKNEPGARAR
jgi:hypothetical protein